MPTLGASHWPGWDKVTEPFEGGIDSAAKLGGTIVLSPKPSGALTKWDGSAWRSLEVLGQGPVGSFCVGLDGQPVVALRDTPVDADGFVFVRRWDGAQWTQLGEGTFVGQRAMHAADVGTSALTVDSSGRLYLAVGRNNDVLVVRWTGDAWEQIGDPVGVGASGLQLLADRRGNLLLAGYAYQTESNTGCVGSQSLRVYRWSGTAWENLGGELAPSDWDMNSGCLYRSVAGFSLAVDGATGQPALAWADDAFHELAGDPNGHLTLVVFDTPDWRTLGSYASSNDLGWPSLSIDGNGAPVLAWSEAPSYGSPATATSVHVQRWTVAGQTELGSMTSDQALSLKASVLGFSGPTTPVVGLEVGPEQGTRGASQFEVLVPQGGG